jgi:hypothetical protein
MDSLTDSHSVNPRNEVLHFLPLGNPALLREDERDDALEAVSGVKEASAVWAVGTEFEFVPLLMVQHELAEHAGSQFLQRSRHELIRQQNFPLVFRASPLPATPALVAVSVITQVIFVEKILIRLVYLSFFLDALLSFPWHK